MNNPYIFKDANLKIGSKYNLDSHNNNQANSILTITPNFPESDIDGIDIKSQLEHQFQIQETKESGWRFDEITSMKKSFNKTGEMNDSTYVK